MSVHIRPWVLGFALFNEDVRHHLVDLRHQLEQGVVGQVFQCKLSLTCVPRVSLAKYSMTIPRNNLNIRNMVNRRLKCYVRVKNPLSLYN